MVTRKDIQPSVFRALGDPVRWEIVRVLGNGPMPVTPLADRFAVSRPAISRHLRVLAEAGLVTSEQSGRNNVYCLQASRLQEAEEWLRLAWRGRLESLKQLAEEAEHGR